jgi:hypothetical protein
MKDRTIRQRLGIGVVMVAVVGIVALATGGASAQGKVDVTGKWQLTVDSAAGTGTPTATFKQDGEKISGHYSSQQLGEADFTGSVKGMTITFSFNADAGGVALAVTYTGTIEGKDAMKGKVVLGELGEGTWTAKRL